MSRSLIEKLNGKGKVFEGKNFIADVSYDIRVYQHYSETRLLNGTARTPGIGTVELQIIPTASVSGLLGTRLTLHMNDARKQDFFPASSDGNCKATGGPY